MSQSDRKSRAPPGEQWKASPAVVASELPRDAHEAWLSLAFEAAGLAYWEWNSSGLIVSPALFDLFGTDPTDPSFELWSPRLHADERDDVLAAIDAARTSGRELEKRFRIVRDDGSTRWCAMHARTLEDPDGRSGRMIGVLRDETELVMARNRERRLKSELLHRVRNVLAVIRSIMRRTAATAPSVEDFASHFEGRLDAVTRLQSLILQREDGGVDLEILVRDELRSAAAGAQTIIDGPVVNLPLKMAQPISLAVHELTTNAVKFGALSKPDGALEVRWTVTGLDLTLSWRESGVRIGPMPRVPGVGQELLERALPYQIGARVSYAFDPEGFWCEISVPLPPAQAPRHTDSGGT